MKGLAGLTMIGPTSTAMLSSHAWAKPEMDSSKPPILVVLELSGGNDGLNTVVPMAMIIITGYGNRWNSPEKLLP